MDLIDETLKNTVDNVDIGLNTALKELQTAIANAEALLESLVDNKTADHTTNKTTESMSGMKQNQKEFLANGTIDCGTS